MNGLELGNVENAFLKLAGKTKLIDDSQVERRVWVYDVSDAQKYQLICAETFRDPEEFAAALDLRNVSRGCGRGDCFYNVNYRVACLRGSIDLPIKGALLYEDSRSNLGAVPDFDVGAACTVLVWKYIHDSSRDHDLFYNSWRVVSYEPVGDCGSESYRQIKDREAVLDFIDDEGVSEEILAWLSQAAIDGLARAIRSGYVNRVDVRGASLRKVRQALTIRESAEEVVVGGVPTAKYVKLEKELTSDPDNLRFGTSGSWYREDRYVLKSTERVNPVFRYGDYGWALGLVRHKTPVWKNGSGYDREYYTLVLV